MENQHKEENQMLWKIAGFKKDIIQDCKADGHHATMIGILLIVVGVYATIAWSIFFSSVVDEWIFAIPLGLFMGLFIFFLDRALISSLAKSKQNFSFQFMASAGFRLLLAVIIGYVLAEPVVNAIYHSEIDREAQVLITEKNKALKDKLENEYQAEIAVLEARKVDLRNELDTYKTTYEKASDDFAREMDGTGGSGNVGYKEIARKKEGLLNTAKDNYETQRRRIQPKIDEADQRIAAIETEITAKYDAFKAETSSIGPLLQSEALESLKLKDETGTLKYKHWLLLSILVLIELSAFIVKLIYSTKSYSETIENLNQEERNLRHIQTEVALEKQRLFKQEAVKKEEQLIQAFFRETEQSNKERFVNLMDDWKSKNYSYNQLWLKFKEDFTFFRF